MSKGEKMNLETWVLLSFLAVFVFATILIDNPIENYDESEKIGDLYHNKEYVESRCGTGHKGKVWIVNNGTHCIEVRGKYDGYWLWGTNPEPSLSKESDNKGDD